ncbi:hypothetical protein GCM10010495_81020 [Kitasatospora herbaricolor]|uniref:DUF6286 domain-containing protein n=1 Tax=Kitasatospora herbaricolor TaxID=68217 RepID=UPI00174E11C1|nr:DUF6286 domain-containing protein [Kitasatospora herbaricolor]MDQ0306184.1 hypothetical protein [Kitasatospora herbaricolor]GGV51162.1 hypothetical protein GCM10010495_81020 [Kitasatospora herbaricolor]
MTHQTPAVSDPDPEAPTPGYPPVNAPSGRTTAGPDHGRARSGRAAPRWWSERRVPAAAAALVVLVAGALLLFDVARVRTGHTAAAWRKTLADELATRPIDDPWVITGAAVAAALGLLLLVLALTPGRRHLLPMAAADDPDAPRAALDRDGAARLLRDAALRVPGVSHAGIRVRRRRIDARAQVAFRDLDTVRTEVTEALTAQLDALALARIPRLTVRARRHGP